MTKADTSDNPVTVIKNGFAAIKNNPKALAGYTIEERKAIESAARTGIVSNILRIPGSRIVPLIGLGTGDVTGATATALGGIASRGGREKLQALRAMNVAKTIAGEKPVEVAPFVRARALGTFQGINSAKTKNDK